jgi:hypothetical protein
MVMRGAWAVVLGWLSALAICGSAQAQSADQLVDAIKSADAACDAHGFATHAEFGACYNARERSAWATFAPAALPYFDDYAAARLSLDRQIDENAITLDAGTRDIKNYGTLFVYQITHLAGTDQRQQQVEPQQDADRQAETDEERLRINEETARAYLAGNQAADAQAQADQQAQARSERWEELGEIARGILLGVAAGADARAAADRVAAHALQQQHTTCQQVGTEVDCTTTNY